MLADSLKRRDNPKTIIDEKVAKFHIYAQPSNQPINIYFQKEKPK